MKTPKSKENNSEKNTELTGKEKRMLNLEKNKWKKGESGNNNGRPIGTRNWSTIYKESLKLLAKKEKKTPDQIEDEILLTGIVLAKKGSYNFFKDMQDRKHGTAPETVTIEHKGIMAMSDKELDELIIKQERRFKKKD